MDVGVDIKTANAAAALCPRRSPERLRTSQKSAAAAYMKQHADLAHRVDLIDMSGRFRRAGRLALGPCARAARHIAPAVCGVPGKFASRAVSRALVVTRWLPSSCRAGPSRGGTKHKLGRSEHLRRTESTLADASPQLAHRRPEPTQDFGRPTGGNRGQFCGVRLVACRGCARTFSRSHVCPRSPGEASTCRALGSAALARTSSALCHDAHLGRRWGRRATSAVDRSSVASLVGPLVGRPSVARRFGSPSSVVGSVRGWARPRSASPTRSPSVRAGTSPDVLRRRLLWWTPQAPEAKRIEWTGAFYVTSCRSRCTFALPGSGWRCPEL